MSRILFEDGFYVACETKAGLTVQSKRSGKGTAYKQDHPQYAEYVGSFATAMDAKENHDFCRFLMG